MPTSPTDLRPGSPCPRCGKPLHDPEDAAAVAGHPVGGDADWVGSGPVTFACRACGAQVPTQLRRTQYFDGSPTTYA